MTNQKGIRFEVLEAWRKQNNLFLAQAAEAFGMNVTRWDTLLKQNAYIIDRRILRIFFLYKRYPQALLQQQVDYRDLYNSFSFDTESTDDRIQFAKLVGVSRSSSYRILDNNHAGRVIRNYILAIKRMNALPDLSRNVMEIVANIADDSAMRGRQELRKLVKQEVVLHAEGA
ncbi:TPA: hypothetical protein MO340_004221 [Salmonella enterica subsp. salamae serovar 35:g,m,s,t:-]|nr:hypothetical protein [Salmonella enterica subsp. salamae serovar 35:g,m,s,t:-]HCA3549693.1 hypothetical protein [Salmonella enterica subsp. salamae serovar 35:g,m,s,t:-]